MTSVSLAVPGVGRVGLHVAERADAQQLDAMASLADPVRIRPVQAPRQRWRNRAGDQIMAPVRTARPESEAELAEVVAAAAADGLEVHAVGSGHSFTDCATSTGLTVDTTGLRRVLSVDHARGQITVEAGIKLYELGPALAANGLALENQGDIDRQSIAGAISTATHGTGLAFANLSSQVVGMRLVTADGEVHELSREQDPEAFLAARVSIGALGVISALTLQCVPLYTLRRQDSCRPLDETLTRLDELAETHDHFEFYVFPYTRRAGVRESRRLDADPQPSPRWQRIVQEGGVENVALMALAGTGKRIPRLVPALNRTLVSLLRENLTEDRAYRVYASLRRVRFNEMEYGLPRAAMAEAIPRVLEFAERRRLPILFPLEIRFAAGDDAFLSTAYGRETGYLAVHQYRGMEFETYFRGVEAIMDEYDGRPHWGKRHYQTAATLAERYPEWHRFTAVRDRLDPQRTFANDYTRRVLG
jgi:L-gulonolactone oxidase